MARHVLMVLTSHDKLGTTGKQTGWYLPELAHPYDEFKKAGYTMTFASPKGGVAPLDQQSIEATKDDPSCVAFITNSDTKALADNTTALSTITNISKFDAVFFVGGFGTMWDFPDSSDAQRIIREMWDAGKIVSAVCHGPCAFANVKNADGSYFVAGKRVTAFCNEEEDAVDRRTVVPWTCEDKLKERGANFSKGGVFQPHVVVDGKLMTGQNPPSAKPLAEAVIAALS